MQVQDDGTDLRVIGKQPDPDIPHNQEDNYQTAINDDEQDDTIQFGNPVTQPFLSRSIRVPIREVGCLSIMQMLQDYLYAYPPFTQADAYSQIQGMAQWLDMYLSKYPAQYINCMTSESEFVALVNHAIQLALDLTSYPNIWALFSILLGTQDVNMSYIQTMHEYYNQCYNTRTEEYMVTLEKAVEQSKIICIIILLMEFQHMYSNQCAIHWCSQVINMMPMQRTAHNYHIMLILMTY